MMGSMVLAAVLLVAPSVAFASEDAVTQDVVVSMNADQVRAVLADTSLAMSMSKDIISHRIEDDAPCQLVHITTRGLTAPLNYTVRRCPTATGFKESLVQGDELIEAMEVEWRTSPHEDGTRVRLSVLTRIGRVPQLLVNQQVRQGVSQTLRNLVRVVEPKAR
jgi:hypothetical protein